ncbi:MAG TPA: hypothetical protein ENN81_00260 [Phycisphaerales bacterium]|nr:hypothetical protein [Phycisphaerales bacterium]
MNKDLQDEWKRFLWIAAVFAVCFWLPVENVRFHIAVSEALALVRWYARTHVLSAVLPACLMAGAISTFVSKAAVVRYLDAGANRVVSYGVASVSGAILPVCSCMVLPLFAGIRRMGAGLGPACAFLHSGPAINVLAVVLTARVLGAGLGVARAAGGIGFSVIIGLAMHLIYRREELNEAKAQMATAWTQAREPRALWQTGLLVGAMAAVLVAINWARTGDVRAIFLCCPEGLTAYQVEGELVNRTAAVVTVRDKDGRIHEIPTNVLAAVRPVSENRLRRIIYRLRWPFVLLVLGGCVWIVPSWLTGAEMKEWVGDSWGYAKRILPLLLMGVLASGFLLGRPGHDGLLPGRYVEMMVGASPDRFLEAMGYHSEGLDGVIRLLWPLWTNLFAAIMGVFMYFSTLTEVPIVQGLMGAGMGKGPALALLLAGPALSLPSMLVIRSVMGTSKTLTFSLLVVLTAAGSGMLYGRLF